jgi:hypothetical protein
MRQGDRVWGPLSDFIAHVLEAIEDDADEAIIDLLWSALAVSTLWQIGAGRVDT